mgnify:CR=1 FL=1
MWLPGTPGADADRSFDDGRSTPTSTDEGAEPPTPTAAVPQDALTVLFKDDDAASVFVPAPLNAEDVTSRGPSVPGDEPSRPSSFIVPISLISVTRIFTRTTRTTPSRLDT